MGGTVLSQAKDGVRNDEQAWGFTGGGSSLFIQEPEWQKSEANVNRPCLLLHPDGTPIPPGTVCRGLPDVAALSGNTGQGLRTVTYDEPSAVGGTSLSSPLMMGIWARVLAAADKPVGPAAPAIYHLAPQRRASAFHDIVAGEAIGNGLYTPAPGWDYNTGYGVPNVAGLAVAVTGRATPAHPLARAEVPDLPTGSTTGDPTGCLPFGTSPVGNVDPTVLGETTEEIDLTKASMDLSRDGKSLVITVHGPKLAPSFPIEYQGSFVKVAWTYGGVAYEAAAMNIASGTTGTAFKLSEDPTAQPEREAATAMYTTGTVTISVPLSEIGHPHSGDRLSEPVVDSGFITNLAALDIPEIDDAAGPIRDYTVGQQCRQPAADPTSGHHRAGHHRTW